jgi:chemotaxis family two-component system sensor kinase Cph1
MVAVRMTGTPLLAPGATVDLDNCHREPIHTPGGVQPHGVLLACDPEGSVVQVSENAATLLGSEPSALLAASLADVLGADAATQLTERAGGDATNLRPLTLTVAGRGLDAFAYRSPDGVLVIELEPVLSRPSFEAFQGDVTRSISALQTARSTDGLLRVAARVVRELTGFDRVWVYRFEPDDHGVVVAEEKPADLPGYLGLHFPAHDIPPQARALFLRNRLRFIVDSGADASPLIPMANPLTDEWLDLSDGVLRAVSPMHLQYLRNMGAHASMSIALSVGGRLWGLISGHHYAAPRLVEHQARAACELVGMVTSMQLASKLELESSERLRVLDARRNAVLESIADAATITAGFANAAGDLLGICAADGAAVRVGDEVELIGATPSQEQVLALIGSLSAAGDGEIFATDRLAEAFPELAALSPTAAGIIALPLSQRRGNYVLWFRPEWHRDLAWGDNGLAPSGAPAVDDRLAPAGSFRTWAESVDGASRPWDDVEVEATGRLRTAVGTFLLERAEQLAALNTELARSNADLDAFAYTVAHDLKEPLRGIHNYVTFFIEDFHDTLDAQGRGQLSTVLSVAQRMGGLLDALLDYSRLGRVELELEHVTLSEIVEDAADMVRGVLDESGARLDVIDGGPPLVGDRERLRHVLANLITNAVKYGGRPQPLVEISTRRLDETQLGLQLRPEARGASVICVRDDGIGIAPEHREVIFDIFRRLHPRGAYGGGTGAGLTIARRIAERHGGALWLDSSEPGRGSTFCLTVEGP